MINHFRHSEKFLRVGGFWSSALDAASYRSTDALYDEHSKTTYARDNNVGICKYTRIYLPEGTPTAYEDRQYLWNQAMKAEEKKDGTYKSRAQYAHEIELSLSNKLTYEQALKVCDEYGQRLASQGMIADLSLHWKDENHHVHIMVPTRAIDMGTGLFSKTKTRKVKDQNGKPRCESLTPWFDAEHLQERRHWTAEIQNQYLEKEDQISEKSFKDQGIDRTPKPSLLHSDWEALQAYKKDPKTPVHVIQKEKFQQRVYMDKIDEMQEKIDTIAEENELETRLHDIAIKTLPDKVKWHSLDPDDVAEYGEYGLLVSEVWMKRYNKYLEKAGMSEYKVTHPLDLCEHLAPGCEIKDIHTYYDKAEIIRPEPTIDRVQQALYKTLPETVRLTKDEMKASAQNPSVTGEKVLNQWLRSYNAYAEKAGMEKLQDVSDLCRAIYDDGKVERCARRYALVYEKAGKHLRIEENKNPVKPIQKTVTHTPVPVPVKKTAPPVQTQSRSQIGETIAAGIESLGARTGGKGVSEQTIDDMTKGYSKLIAALVRALSAVLKQASKEIRKKPQSIREPIKTVVKKEPEKPAKPKEKPKAEPKAPDKKVAPVAPISMDMDQRMAEAQKRAQEKKKAVKKIAKKVTKTNKISIDLER